jgi:hypothetical protein
MKQRFVLFSSLILLGCVFLLFTGCPVDAGDDQANGTEADNDDIDIDIDDDDGETKQEAGITTIKNLTITNGTKYLSLGTGKQVPASKKNTAEWDIAVAASMFVFRTNSGVTAEAAGSPGNAAIWHVDKTDFNDVTLADRPDLTGTEYEPYTQDVTRYSSLMNGVSSVPMNIMTYFGFNGGTGLTAEDPFTSIPRDSTTTPLTDYVFYHFNKKAAYIGTGGMPQGFKETKQIYIVRHADGQHHSKFQVTAFTYGYAMDLKFSQLD